MSDQVAEQGTVETPEQQEESQALSAGYAKARGETPVEAKEPAKAESQEPGSETKVEAKTETPDPKAEEAAAQAAADAEWEGVPVKVRQMLEGISSKVGTIDKLQHDFKSIAGRTGAALEGVHALKTAMEAAKAATKEAGTEAPTQAQISAAASSGKKWKAIKADFPEWAEATEELLAAQAAAKPQAAVDVEGLRKQIMSEVQVNARQIRELGKVDAKYPDWEDTINTDDFLNWSTAGGPPANEYQRVKELTQTAPQEAAQLKVDFQRRFPQWYAEKGALIYSDSARDAVKLLDTYNEHQKAAAAKAAVETKNRQRLAANVTPRQASSGGPSILPDEAGLSVGYNRVRRA